mgnify:CR=1 FL=1
MSVLSSNPPLAATAVGPREEVTLKPTARLVRCIGKALDFERESVGLIELDPCAFSSNPIVAVQEELAPTAFGLRAVEIEPECVSHSPVNDEIARDQEPGGTVGIDMSPHIEEGRFVSYDGSHERLLDGREWPIDAAHLERCHEHIVPGMCAERKWICSRVMCGPAQSRVLRASVSHGRFGRHLGGDASS